MTAADIDREYTAGQPANGVSELPKTLGEAKAELSRLAYTKAPIGEPEFLFHAANAMYLAQEEFERRQGRVGHVEHRLPRPAREKAVESLVASECFRRFCENQGSAEAMAKLFEGEVGARRALQQFGAAIRQHERDKSAKGAAEQAPEQQAAAQDGKKQDGPALA